MRHLGITGLLLVLSWGVASPGQAQSSYETKTSRHRLAQCKARVETIRDRMKPGMQAMFSVQPSMPVTVTKELMMNAYADGYAITFSPVICEEFPDDDQFSIIVGHEIAHNLLGHYSEMMTGKSLGTLADLALAGLTGVYTNTGSTMGGVAFNKDREREADYYGLYLAAYAGYDIGDAPDLWRSFSLKTGGGEGGMTHPSNPERSARAMLVVVDVAHKQRDGKPPLPDEPPLPASTGLKPSTRED